MVAEQQPPSPFSGDPNAPIPMPGTANTLPNAPMKDTKFAKLLKIAVPIVSGGLTGGFGGNWREPGSGNTAAQNFFGQQNELALRKMQLQQQLKQDAIINQLRQSEEARNDFYDRYLAAHTEEAEAAAHQKENPIQKVPPKHVEQLSGYPGTAIETEGPEAGTTIQLTKPGSAPTDDTDLSNYGAEGKKQGIPLGPPQATIDKEAAAAKKDTKPQPEIVSDTDATGASTSYFVDKNPDSPTFGKRMKQVGSKAAKKPQLSAGQDIQAKADYALQAFGNDPKKATAFVQGSKTLKPAEKALVIAAINKPKSTKLDAATLGRLAAGVGGGGNSIPTGP